jgi:hypothetical protein
MVPAKAPARWPFAQDLATASIDNQTHPHATPANRPDHINRTTFIDDPNAVKAAMTQAAADLTWPHAVPAVAMITPPVPAVFTFVARPIAVVDIQNERSATNLKLASLARRRFHGSNQSRGNKDCGNRCGKKLFGHEHFSISSTVLISTALMLRRLCPIPLERKRKHPFI